MLKPFPTTAFRRDLRKCQKRGLPVNELREVILALSEEKPLDARYRDHRLSGNYAG